MAYNYLTDFVGLWRATSGGVEKGEMPGLDFVVAALGRAGILNLVISGSPPIVNQDTTAWFKPSASPPDYAAEGVLYLWDGTQYVPATPGLFFTFLSVSLNANSLAIWLVTGAPSNLVGHNGDLALRTDAPGGIYGPKASGVWPADPLPGTSYSQISAFLDVLGTAQGDIIYRGASSWVVLAPGTAGQILVTGGAAANPAWSSSSGIVNAGLDAIGSTQGDILYRNATVWTVLAPGTAGQLLRSGGAAANPSWVTASAAFVLNSAAVDAAFGATAGGVLVRGAAWANSGAGSAGQVLTSNGTSAPTFQTFVTTSASLDALFGAVQGSVIYRNATVWTALGPGVSGQLLQTGGAAANPSWVNPGSIAPSFGAIGALAMIDDDGSGLLTPGYGTVFVSNGVPLYAGTAIGFVPNGTTWRNLGASGANGGGGFPIFLCQRVS